MKQSSCAFGFVIYVLLLGGCTWSKPADKASQVRLATAGQVSECEKVAATHVSIMDKLESMNQIDGKVAAELASLARNSALQMGGNTIVAITGIKDGTQSFAIYKCR